jgi:hypothetical protein
MMLQPQMTMVQMVPVMPATQSFAPAGPAYPSLLLSRRMQAGKSFQAEKMPKPTKAKDAEHHCAHEHYVTDDESAHSRYVTDDESGDEAQPVATNMVQPSQTVQLPQMAMMQMVPVMQPIQGFPSAAFQYPTLLMARGQGIGLAGKVPTLPPGNLKGNVGAPQPLAQGALDDHEMPASKDRARFNMHRMLQSLEQGDGAAVLPALTGQVARFARDKLGCRVVQKALDCASPQQVRTLAAEMVGSVKQAVRCPNGNFVIQKIVTRSSADDFEFVAEELLGKAADVAKHRYGCRVACRIVERRGDVEQASGVAEFVSELLERALDLSQHPFAHFAMQSILEHGAARERQKIAAALRPCILANARGRSSSYVLASALECCDEVDQATLVMDLLEHLPSLAQSLSGCHVIKAHLTVAGSRLPEAAKRLQEVAAELAGTRHGQRIIQAFGLSSHW